MITLATDAALLLMVLCVWLACAGFLRLASALDRLHVTSFVYASAGVLLLLAAGLSDGFSIRLLKIAFMQACGLVGGAASNHAIGRALVLRGSIGQAEIEAKLRRAECG